MSHPLSLSTIKHTLKHFLLKQNELSRSAFSKVIYMPFRLSSINPIFHVFFHHEMLTLNVIQRVSFDSQKIWKCSALAERKNKTKQNNNLARVENAPCWIFISFNRQPEHIRVSLWNATEALKSLSLCCNTQWAHLCCFCLLASCFVAGCDYWTLKFAAAGKPDKEWRKIPIWKWICRLRTIA